MVCYGSLQLYREARRLHKITDDIIMVAEGEYSDFQELQTMFQVFFSLSPPFPPFFLLLFFSFSFPPFFVFVFVPRLYS